MRDRIIFCVVNTDVNAKALVNSGESCVENLTGNILCERENARSVAILCDPHHLSSSTNSVITIINLMLCKFMLCVYISCLCLVFQYGTFFEVVIWVQQCWSGVIEIWNANVCAQMCLFVLPSCGPDVLDNPVIHSLKLILVCMKLFIATLMKR